MGGDKAPEKEAGKTKEHRVAMRKEDKMRVKKGSEERHSGKHRRQ
jgi:hypothetical protein